MVKKCTDGEEGFDYLKEDLQHSTSELVLVLPKVSSGDDIAQKPLDPNLKALPFNLF